MNDRKCRVEITIWIYNNRKFPTDITSGFPICDNSIFRFDGFFEKLKKTKENINKIKFTSPPKHLQGTNGSYRYIFVFEN